MRLVGLAVGAVFLGLLSAAAGRGPTTPPLEGEAKALPYLES